MKANQLRDLLLQLNDRELVEILNETFSLRAKTGGGERSYISKFVVGKVVIFKEQHEPGSGPQRRKASDNREFSFDLLSSFDQEWYPEGSIGYDDICQEGWCCGFEVSSYVKHSICPICGGKVFGT